MGTAKWRPLFIFSFWHFFVILCRNFYSASVIRLRQLLKNHPVTSFAKDLGSNCLDIVDVLLDVLAHESGDSIFKTNYCWLPDFKMGLHS